MAYPTGIIGSASSRLLAAHTDELQAQPGADLLIRFYIICFNFSPASLWYQKTYCFERLENLEKVEYTTKNRYVLIKYLELKIY